MNIFLNSRIDKGKDNRRVYCQLLLGYKELGFLQGQDDSIILELDKALYRLRESPLLQNQEFSSILRELGLTRSTEELCIFVSEYILILFYIDDILTLYRKEYKEKAAQLIQQISSRYKIREEGDIKQFLVIQVIQDRTACKIYLY